ncbi:MULTISPECIES: type II toxin-antitoxin system Phd/YefM family antitoxin [Cysteiniphilum]|uniref:type II toxin-antitoxin system Phd/YefM family antitoxin n=1 Tax=Cysteiniphilum TaxID=2056696 RepID=UPI000E6474E3|nr:MULTISPECIES: type II toxin-antitoxin system prevent-host-death family antitoxin [Cysteiniphilum]
MEKVTYSKCRNNLASMINKVNDDHAPLLITRERGKDAVLMSLEDYNAYNETLYLMSSPENAKQLNKAIHDLEKMKNVIQRDLME